MIRLELIRNYSGDFLDPEKPCFGELKLYDPELFYPLSFCDTLEPAVKKRFGRIPKGRYIIDYVKSPRFGRRMLRLRFVPGRQGILIHAGNYEKDTRGCILVGEHVSGTDTLKYSGSCLIDLIKRLGIKENRDYKHVAEICIIEDELPF